MRASTPEEAAEAINLHKQMMALLAQLSTLPYGSVMNYNADGGGRSNEHPGGNEPGGVAFSDEDKFRARWHACKTVRDGRECVKAAEDALDAWRHSKAQEPGETQKQRYARIVRVGEGWQDRECAAALRETMNEVHAARKAHQRDPVKGLPLAGATAAELLRRGNTVRFVEAALKIPKSTVYDRARKAA